MSWYSHGTVCLSEDGIPSMTETSETVVFNFGTSTMAISHPCVSLSVGAFPPNLDNSQIRKGLLLSPRPRHWPHRLVQSCRILGATIQMQSVRSSRGPTRESQQKQKSST